jgi:exopolyphosphatase/guanosine-5'-triphosphate,3'-diphosphate pyrophosphatase
MIVARIVNGHVQILDRLREMVQLAAGLDGRNRLSADSQQRALECLARFGQRLRHIPPARLRIVGTNTLRQARNSAEFITRAEQVLGHRVEIVSGQEEARLIYLGVAHSVGDVTGQRLVIDIGGGSTELIIGEKFEPRHLASLRMGCVSLSRACFADGRVTAGAPARSRIARSTATSHRCAKSIWRVAGKWSPALPDRSRPFRTCSSAKAGAVRGSP